MSLRIVATSLLVTALVACTDGAPPKPIDAPPAPPATAPASLQAAHLAYLEGNWNALGERVRDVLLDPSANDLARENAYALLDKSYAVQGGRLPTTSTLPADFMFAKYSAIRINTPYATAYVVNLRIRVRNAKRIKSVRLERLPGETVVEASDKLEISPEEPGWEDITVNSPKLTALPADGVFTLRMVFDDGTASETWFIGHSLESSGSPEVEAPTVNATMNDKNPRIAWRSFRSPQYAPYENRTLNVWIGVGKDYRDAWNYWTAEPGETSAVRVGAQEGAPRMTLEPGDYWYTVTHGEERRFGPFILMRGSQAAGPMHIVR